MDTHAEPIPDVIAEFARALRDEPGLAEASVVHYTRLVTHALRWFTETLPGTDILRASPTQIERHLANLTASGLSDSTRGATLSAMRSFYRFANGPDGHNPANAVNHLSVRRPAVRAYTDAEVATILATTANSDDVFSGYDHALVTTLRHTGARTAEVVRLDVQDYDPAGRTVGVGARSTAVRIVPVPEPACRVLDRHLREVRPLFARDAALFPNARDLAGDPRLSVHAVASIVKRRGRRSGVRGPHNPTRWRRTYAVDLLDRGIDHRTIQSRLGYSTLWGVRSYLGIRADGTPVDRDPHRP